jgi:protoheme IX farnesyltransferase
MSHASLALPQPRLVALSRDYLQLSKSRIVLMVLVTTAAGYLFGTADVHALALLHLLVGTALVAAGTNALNQYVEREHDAKMRRTRLRPLPDGRITPRAALIFAAGIAVIGTLYLGFLVNWLTAGLGALTLTSYIFVYTPLKRISAICTLVGAVPGALPPLMGWTAATGSLGMGGWILFGILFFWQLPHFMAISWVYREDYGQAGFIMTSVGDDAGKASSSQAVLWSLPLLAVTMLPAFTGMTGLAYLIGALIANTAMILAAVRFYFNPAKRTAMQLFMTSNAYLIAVMVLLIAGARH